MRIALVALLGLLGVAIPPVTAQQPPYGGESGERGGRRMEGGRPAHPLPTEDQLQGPPDPGFMADRFELDSVEARGYQQVFDSFMTATATERDTALAARREIQAAFERRDFASARGDIPLVQRLGQDLERQEKVFDDRVKQVLTSRHFKDYHKWKDDQRKQAEAAQEEEMRRRRGSAGPGSDDPQPE